MLSGNGMVDQPRDALSLFRLGIRLEECIRHIMDPFNVDLTNEAKIN